MIEYDDLIHHSIINEIIHLIMQVAPINTLPCIKRDDCYIFYSNDLHNTTFSISQNYIVFFFLVEVNNVN